MEGCWVEGERMLRGGRGETEGGEEGRREGKEV